MPKLQKEKMLAKSSATTATKKTIFLEIVVSLPKKKLVTVLVTSMSVTASLELDASSKAGASIKFSEILQSVPCL